MFTSLKIAWYRRKLRSKDRAIRSASISALVAIGGEPCYELIASASWDEDHGVRNEAVTALTDAGKQQILVDKAKALASTGERSVSRDRLSRMLPLLDDATTEAVLKWYICSEKHYTSTLSKTDEAGREVHCYSMKEPNFELLLSTIEGWQPTERPERWLDALNRFDGGHDDDDGSEFWPTNRAIHGLSSARNIPRIGSQPREPEIEARFHTRVAKIRSLIKSEQDRLAFVRTRADLMPPVQSSSPYSSDSSDKSAISPPKRPPSPFGRP